jgi:hypothetical protein
MTTPRIGPIEGGEDYLGLSPPFISPLPLPPYPTCSVGIAGSVYVATGITSPGNVLNAYPSVSITPTPGPLSSVIFGGYHGVGSENASWTVGAGWTDLGHGPSGSNGAPYLATMYQAILNPSGVYTPNGILGRGTLNPWDPLPNYLMIAASIVTASSSPVQSGFGRYNTAWVNTWIALSPPTLGNIIVMIAASRGQDFGVMIPATGWTQLGETGIGDNHIAIWMRCADPADGNDYGFQPISVEYSMSVTEWTP